MASTLMMSTASAYSSMLMEQTSTAVPDDPDLTKTDENRKILAVYYSEPFKFYLLHIFGLCSLIVSSITSFTLIVLILNRYKTKFWSATDADRLGLYISTNDLFFCLSHMSDHSLLMARPEVIYEGACTFQAFCLVFLGLAEASLVIIAGVSCVLKVVFNKKFGFGKYDWKIHLLANGPALLTTIVLVSMDVLGPSGVWCLIDGRREDAVVWNALLSVLVGSALFVDTTCYSMVFYKISVNQRSMDAYGNQGNQTNQQRGDKFLRAKYKMIGFVLAYMIRFFPYFVYTVWFVFAIPPTPVVFFNVLVVNMCGVLNAMVYVSFRPSRRISPASNGS